MLHRFFICFFFLCGASITIVAQDKWTLKQCIDYALEHNINVKQQKNVVKKLKVEKRNLQTSYLPDLSIVTSQKLDFGRSLNRSNTYNDVNSQSSSFSLSSEIPLFTGFKISNSISKNKYDLQAAFENLEEIKNDLSLNITAGYFQILLNKEITKISQEQIGLIKEQEDRTKVLIENGKVPQSQLYDILAQLADDELNVTEAMNTLKMSLLDLSQLLELKEKGKFDVTEIETLPDSMILNSPDDVSLFAQENMPQIKRAQYNLQGSMKAVKIAQSGYYPTLSLGADISSSYYHVGGESNPPFYEQFKNNMQKSLYLTLRIPLFDRLSTQNNVHTAQIDTDNSRLALESEKKTLYKKIQKAYMDAVASKDKLTSTSRAVFANTEAYRYAKERYSAGKSSVYEYNESKMKLANALSEQAQAKYTYLLKMKILEFYSGKPLNE